MRKFSRRVLSAVMAISLVILSTSMPIYAEEYNENDSIITEEYADDYDGFEQDVVLDDEEEIGFSANTYAAIYQGDDLSVGLEKLVEQAKIDSMNKHFIIFYEGFRDGRLEMSSFDAEKDFKVVWNTGIDVTNYTDTINQYYYNDEEKFEFIGTYHRITDKTNEIVASTVDIYDDLGNVVFYANVQEDILDDEEDDDYFKLGVDTNQFSHSGLPYSIDNSEYKTQLYKSTLMTWDGTVQVYRYLDGKTSGVCHGIATTMCYGNQGELNFESIVKDANNYWELGDPRNNTNFKDLIVYYHLLQLSTEGKATKTLDKDGWHIIPQNERMEDFFDSLINEAKKSSETKKTIYFFV